MAHKRKLLWRFRKGSDADPFRILDCGCKQYVYDGTIGCMRPQSGWGKQGFVDINTNEGREVIRCYCGGTYATETN